MDGGSPARCGVGLGQWEGGAKWVWITYSYCAFPLSKTDMRDLELPGISYSTVSGVWTLPFSLLRSEQIVKKKDNEMDVQEIRRSLPEVFQVNICTSGRICRVSIPLVETSDPS